MKYTGRIALSLFVCITTIGWMVYHYQEDGFFRWVELYVNLPMIVLAWYLGKRHDQATYYAHHDILTNVYNRNYIGKAVPKMLRKLENSSGSLTIFIIDIDNFKDINDTFGHQMGDSVLEQVASTLKAEIRNTDTVGRLGGDEFVLGLQNINPQAAKKIMNRWKEKLESIEVEQNIKVRISIGSSSFPHDGRNFDELYHVADQNMYLDKPQNKDPIVCI